MLFRVRADGGGKRLCRLSGAEFIRRFLLHVLPRGFKRVRRYGLLLPARKKAGLAAVRAALNVPPPQPAVIETVAEFLYRVARLDFECCPRCGTGRFRVTAVIPSQPWMPGPRASP